MPTKYKQLQRHFLPDNNLEKAVCGMFIIKNYNRTTSRLTKVTCGRCIRVEFAKMGYHFRKIEDGTDLNRIHYQYLADAGTVDGGNVVSSATVVNPVSGFSAFITNLGTSLEHRNRGLATALVRQILRETKPPVQVHIRPNVRDEDSTSILDEDGLHKFYGHLDFVEYVPKNDYMIWYPPLFYPLLPGQPEKVEGTQSSHKIYVREIDGLYTARALKHGEFVRSENSSFEAAVGQLICRYPDFFGVVLEKVAITKDEVL